MFEVVIASLAVFWSVSKSIISFIFIKGARSGNRQVTNKEVYLLLNKLEKRYVSVRLYNEGAVRLRFCILFLWCAYKGFVHLPTKATDPVILPLHEDN